MKRQYTRQQIMLATDEELYEMSANTDSRADIVTISAELHYRQAVDTVDETAEAVNLIVDRYSRGLASFQHIC